MPLPGRHSDLLKKRLLDDFLPATHAKLLKGQFQDEDLVVCPSRRERVVPETAALVVLDVSLSEHAEMQRPLINYKLMNQADNSEGRGVLEDGPGNNLGQRQGNIGRTSS